MKSRPDRSRLRLAALLAAAVVALSAAVAFFLRDTPRRLVERRLAERLGAEVHVGGLSILGTRRFSLHDVEVREIAGPPRIESFLAAEIQVEGAPREIAAGRMDLVRLVDAEVRLAPARSGESPQAGPLDIEVGRILLEDVRAVLRSSAGTATVEVSGELRRAGGRLSGSILVRANRLPLAPLAAFRREQVGASGGIRLAPLLDALAGEIERVEIRLDLHRGADDLQVSAHARAIRLLRGEGEEATILGAALEARVLPSGNGERRRLAVLARLPLASHLSLDAELDRSSLAILRARARAAGVNLGALARLSGALPPGASLGGTAGIVLERDEQGSVRGDLTADFDSIGWPLAGRRLQARGVRARAQALVLPAEAGRSPVRASLFLDVGQENDLPEHACAHVFPLRAAIEGTVVEGRGFEGGGTIETSRLGRVAFEGAAGPTASGPRLDLRWRLSGAALGPLLAAALEAGLLDRRGDLAAEGRLAASGKLSGPLRAPRLDARIAFAQAGLAAGGISPFEISGARVAASICWPSQGGTIALGEVEASGTVAPTPLGPLEARAAAEAELDPRSRRLDLARIRIEVPGIGTLAGSGSVEPGGNPLASFVGSAETAGFDRLREALRPVWGDLAPGFEVGGTARADLRAELFEDGRFSARGAASTSGTRLASAAGDRVLEGLDTRWKVALGGSLSPFRASLEAEGKASGFQLLWGSLYADGSALSSDLSVRLDGATPGAGSGAGVPALRGEARWTLPAGPAWRATLAREGDSPTRFTLNVDVPDLGSAVERYVRGPLGGSLPAAGRIEAAGAASVRLAGEILDRDSGMVSGRVSLAGVSLSETELPAEIAGLDLDLPVALSWRGGALGGARVMGSIAFERAAVGGLEFRPVSTPLAVEADTIEIEKPVALPLLGGAVRLERLKLADLLGAGPRIESAVGLEGLSLAAISELLGLPRLEGKLEGRFPSVRVTAEELEAEGGGDIAAFGGTIRIRGVSGRDLFSRYPKLRFSASFEDVDLGRVTRAFEFGEMTGIVRGYLEDCETFRGTPVRFDARIESVPRKGVPQKIAVKAIQNLAILGTGGPVGALDRGLRKLFDSYTYDELGVEMKLEADAFHLRGLARRRGRELFLKGGFPFPIDIVNADPGRAVSFRSMLERLRGLDFARIRTGRGAQRPP